MKFNKTLQHAVLAVGISMGFAGMGFAADAPNSPSAPPQESAGAVVKDSVITAKIKADFLADKVVGATRISVETVNGTVQLSGFAKSQVEIERAQELAAKVEGVKVVKNDIQLQPNAS